MAQGRPVALVVDDEAHILSFLDENLREDDFHVETAGSIAQAKSRMGARPPDVILLDVGLPDGSGFDFCRSIREADPLSTNVHPDTPVILLTARGEEFDRVRGLQRGADDYVVKPFHYPELLLRIQALLRRVSAQRPAEAASVAGLEVDRVTRTVTVGGTEISLSATEFEFLSLLANDPRKVFSRDELLREIWGYRATGNTRTLDSHASRVRRKLNDASGGRRYIVNVWGVGYRLTDLEGLPQ